MNKLVSIVIPVYNTEKFLYESILDIKNQTWLVMTNTYYQLTNVELYTQTYSINLRRR